MSDFVIAMLFTLGATAWIYNQFAKRTGGSNLKPAIIGAAVSGFIIFIISFTLLTIFIKK